MFTLHGLRITRSHRNACVRTPKPTPNNYRLLSGRRWLPPFAGVKRCLANAVKCDRNLSNKPFGGKLFFTGK